MFKNMIYVFWLQFTAKFYNNRKLKQIMAIVGAILIARIIYFMRNIKGQGWNPAPTNNYNK